MVIFQDINEMLNCMLTLEESFPKKGYPELISYINSIKSLDLLDETKQNLANQKIRETLVRWDFISSTQVLTWIEDKRDDYRNMLDYITKENKWNGNIHV